MRILSNALPLMLETGDSVRAVAAAAATSAAAVDMNSVWATAKLATPKRLIKRMCIVAEDLHKGR